VHHEPHAGLIALELAHQHVGAPQVVLAEARERLGVEQQVRGIEEQRRSTALHRVARLRAGRSRAWMNSGRVTASPASNRVTLLQPSASSWSRAEQPSGMARAGGRLQVLRGLDRS
jgi:hypothetical protein